MRARRMKLFLSNQQIGVDGIEHGSIKEDQRRSMELNMRWLDSESTHCARYMLHSQRRIRSGVYQGWARRRSSTVSSVVCP